MKKKSVLLLLLMAATIFLFTACGGGYTVKGIDDKVNPMDVDGDNTGKWKIVTLAQTGLEPQKIAYDYYKTCFEKGDTVHYIVNFSTNTTTRISDVGGNILEVATTEYVKKEEHDASTLGGGQPLGRWYVHLDTKKIEKIE